MGAIMVFAIAPYDEPDPSGRQATGAIMVFAIAPYGEQVPA